MITLCVDGGDEHLIYHKYSDGHMSGSETEWDIAERMRDVLLLEHTEQDTGGDYLRGMCGWGDCLRKFSEGTRNEYCIEAGRGLASSF